MIDSFKRSNPFEEGSDERKVHEEKILGLFGGPTPGEEMPEDPLEFQLIFSVKLRTILIQNWFHEPGEGQAPWNAVFEGASRANHSCVPNAELVLAEGVGGSRVSYSSMSPLTYETKLLTNTSGPRSPRQHQSRRGEEILLNYLDPLALSGVREKKLRVRCGFACACKLCTRPQREIAASDQRRAALSTTMGLLMASAHNDKFVVGDLGWKRLDALAQEEGVNDTTLFRA